MLLPGPFDAARAAAAISTLRPTTTFCVPTHLQRLLAHGDVDWSSFRRLVHAGAPCPEPLKRAVLEALPDGSVWEFYGSTEAQFTVCSPEDWLAHPGSVGRARPGRRLETDERGQLWCAVPPLGPVRVLAGAGEDGGRLARATWSPSATWAGWTTTAWSGSTAAARTWSSPAA